MVAPYSPDCAVTKQIQIYKNRLNRRLLLNFKILRSLKISRDGDYERGALYFLCAVAGALCEDCYRQRYIASPLSASGAGTERYVPREGRNFTASFEVKF